MFLRLMFDLLTQSSHALRYVLKNRKTNEPLWVLVFTLEPKEGEEKAAETSGAKESGKAESDELD